MLTNREYGENDFKQIEADLNLVRI
jgi:hypothetical protein